MWTVLKFLLTKFQPRAQFQNSPKCTHNRSIGHNRVTFTKSFYFSTHILNEVAAIKPELDIIALKV